MGNIVSSSISGFLKVVGDLFGAPVDFLSGKSCSSACGSTWDLVCYIENFCVANLLKLATVSVLFYIVLLFFYLLHKIGICHCIGRSTCKMLWACLASCFTALEHGGMFMWFKMKKLNRIKRERWTDDTDSSSGGDHRALEEISYRYNNHPKATRFRRSLCHDRSRRRSQLERSLRPRSHRIRVGIGRSSVYVNQTGPRKHARHNIKVTRTTKFVHKGSGTRIHHRRW